MKIDGIGEDHGRSQVPGPSKSRGAGPPSDAPAGAGRDRVEVSDAARRMAGLIEAANRLPEVREEQVAALQQEIRQGTYEVDPGLLARAILEFEDGLYR